jgi:hypothetical protein
MKMACRHCETRIYKSRIQLELEIVMFARHSTLIPLLLSCLACWLSCVIIFGELPELLSLTDNTSNDFAMRRAASVEGMHASSVAKQGAVQIFARALGCSAELREGTVEDTSPTHSALFIINSVLRR